jgi:hypothetical protein
MNFSLGLEVEDCNAMMHYMLTKQERKKNHTSSEDSFSAAAINKWSRVSFFIFLKEAITGIGTA